MSVVQSSVNASDNVAYAAADVLLHVLIRCLIMIVTVQTVKEFGWVFFVTFSSSLSNG